MIEPVGRKTCLPRIFLNEGYRHAPFFCIDSPPLYQVLGKIENGQVFKTPGIEFHAVSAVAPAQVEDLVFRGERYHFENQVDLPPGDIAVVNRPGVGNQVELIEDLLPPVGINIDSHESSGWAPKLKSPSDAKTASDPFQGWDLAISSSSSSMVMKSSISPASHIFSRVRQSDQTAAQ